MPKSVSFKSSVPTSSTNRSLKFEAARPKTKDKSKLYTTKTGKLLSRTKIKEKCSGLTTQHALDKFWVTQHTNFMKIALRMEKAAEDYKDNKDIQNKIIRDRHHMRNELSYVERWIATCAETHQLKNPVLNLLFDR